MDSPDVWVAVGEGVYPPAGAWRPEEDPPGVRWARVPQRAVHALRVSLLREGLSLTGSLPHALRDDMRVYVVVPDQGAPRVDAQRRAAELLTRAGYLEPAHREPT